MRLTKLTGHAIRVLVHCARAGDELIKTSAVASSLGITPSNLFKIVNVLSNAGFVTAVRGPRGGIKLARAPDAIWIGEVVRAIEVTSVEVNGWSEKERRGSKGQGTLSVNGVLDEALEAFVSVLDQHTLADMAFGPGTDPSKRVVAKRSKTGSSKQNVASLNRGR